MLSKESYNIEQLEIWHRLIIKVDTSWATIGELLDQYKVDYNPAIFKDDHRTVALLIAGRWLFPVDGEYRTSNQELIKTFVGRDIDLASDYGYSQQKSARDKIRKITGLLEDALLIEAELEHRNKYFSPCELLIQHCNNSALELKEFLKK